MLPFLLAAAITFTLHDKDVLQPPKASPIAIWTSHASALREPVEFTAKDGSHIRGWLYRAKSADSSDVAANAPTVLFFYGSNEDLVHEQARLAWLSESLHVNAICFDYPGYGFSTGQISVKATRDIALEEYDFISDHVASRGSAGAAAVPPIVAYGWSIGTGLAVHVAAERHVAGLILQAPPASADEMAAWSSQHDVPRLARGIAKVAIDPAVSPIYENVHEIAKVSSPLLVVQGTEDDVVPIAQGREVFSASPAKQKRFVEVPGAHHNDIRVGHPPAGDAVATFLQQLATNGSAKAQTR
jgi:uncharacterized protein